MVSCRLFRRVIAVLLDSGLPKKEDVLFVFIRIHIAQIVILRYDDDDDDDTVDMTVDRVSAACAIHFFLFPLTNSLSLTHTLARLFYSSAKLKGRQADDDDLYTQIK